MAINKGIKMKKYNGTDWDTVYPETTVGQVQGLQSNLEGLRGDIDNHSAAIALKADKAYVDNVVPEVCVSMTEPTASSASI